MNYISTSMVRAALHGIPVVLLGNSFVKRDGKQWSLENRKNNSIVAGMEEVLSVPNVSGRLVFLFETNSTEEFVLSINKMYRDI